MKKLNTYLLVLMGVFALTWSACTDSYDYDPAPGISGEGVYFPSSVKTSITLDGTEGSFTLDVQRTKSEGAAESAVAAEFSEGGAGVFTVPAKVSFADGKTETTLTVNYSKLVRGTDYKVTLSFPDGTPYGGSSLTFSVLYPAEVVEEWVEVSKDAVLIDNMFSAFGVKDFMITGITVEKEKNTNKYRFISPYTTDYFDAIGGGIAFPADYKYSYIIFDGETFKDKAPGQYYIPKTALGFKMVNGAGPSLDETWNTFGSVAGNLSTSAGLIEPGAAAYPMVTYDANAKMFNLGKVYHIIEDKGSSSIMLVDGMLLYLDPALMSPDFDRDYTWNNVDDAAGYFTSEIAGESWMQAVQQAKEDPTFYRFTSLYAKGVHIYFNYDADKGTLTMPKMQPTGFTTFGNKVYVDAVPGKCTVDKDNKFTFVLSFYLADEEGNKTAELMQSTETFLLGKGPLDQLEKGKKIDEYVGTWVVPMTNGEDGGNVPVTITKADETTLLVQGLSIADGYDDTMALGYDAETGFLVFQFQQVASTQGYFGFVAPFNSAAGKVATKAEEMLIGGVTKEGTLMFINSPANEGAYDAMVYIISPDGKQLGFMTGYWNGLEWSPAANPATYGMLGSISMDNGFKTVNKGIIPRRLYKTELNLRATPVNNSVLSTNIQTPIQTEFSLIVR